MTPVDYAVAVGAGALTGFVCAVPVGPINVAIMEVGIHSGRTRALTIALGALLMEMIYCVIAFGGFASLFEDPTIRATVELISFLAVTVFGIRYLMADTVTVQGKRARMIEQRLHPHTIFWTGFVRVLVNQRTPVLDYDFRRAPGQRNVASRLAKPDGLCRWCRTGHCSLVYADRAGKCPGGKSVLGQDSRAVFPRIRPSSTTFVGGDCSAPDWHRGPTRQLSKHTAL